MNALLSEDYFFLTAMDPSAMMYAEAFKWVLEDRPYVGCEFRSLSLRERETQRNKRQLVLVPVEF